VCPKGGQGADQSICLGDDAATLTAEGAVEILHDLSDKLAQNFIEVSCCSTTRNQRLLDWWVSALSSLLNQGEEDIDFCHRFSQMEDGKWEEDKEDEEMGG